MCMPSASVALAENGLTDSWSPTDKAQALFHWLCTMGRAVSILLRSLAVLVSFCHVDTNQGHLGRGNLDWGVVFTRLICRHGCSTFSRLMNNVGEPSLPRVGPPLSRWPWAYEKAVTASYGEEANQHSPCLGFCFHSCLSVPTWAPSLASLRMDSTYKV